MEIKTDISVMGHVHIEDDLGNVLLDQKNAVHPQNMATVIGRGLARSSDYWVNKIYLGNGGASVGSNGAVTYLPPNTSPASATLYNKTYEEVVDETFGSDGNGGSANVVSNASGTGVETVVTVIADLAADQPASQSTTDQAMSTEDDFAFDELGLISNDGLLLSHIIFSPILKSANRAITITYTLTITVSNI